MVLEYDEKIADFLTAPLITINIRVAPKTQERTLAQFLEVALGWREAIRLCNGNHGAHGNHAIERVWRVLCGWAPKSCSGMLTATLVACRKTGGFIMRSPRKASGCRRPDEPLREISKVSRQTERAIQETPNASRLLEKVIQKTPTTFHRKDNAIRKIPNASHRSEKAIRKILTTSCQMVSGHPNFRTSHVLSLGAR